VSNRDTLKINEIFYSIQGESTHAGYPCVFIRLTGCDLRCTYCDTKYAYNEGDDKNITDIIDEIRTFQCKLVEITGGEPLLQKNVLPLMSRLCDSGFDVLLETGGHHDISTVDKRVQRIMDIKCPSSAESDKNHWENINYLTENDQVKFVMGNREDYEWAVDKVNRYRLTHICPVLFAPVYKKIDLKELAEWILRDHLNVRVQLQIQKYIWPAEQRGV